MKIALLALFALLSFDAAAAPPKDSCELKLTSMESVRAFAAGAHTSAFGYREKLVQTLQNLDLDLETRMEAFFTFLNLHAEKYDQIPIWLERYQREIEFFSTEDRAVIDAKIADDSLRTGQLSQWINDKFIADTTSALKFIKLPFIKLAPEIRYFPLERQKEWAEILLAHPAYDPSKMAIKFIAMGSPKIIDLLFANSNLNYNQLALEIAADKSVNLDIFKRVVKRVDDVNATGRISVTSYSTSLLGWAIHAGDIAKMNYLLQLPNIDVNAGDDPPLFVAVRQDNIKFLRLLLQRNELNLFETGSSKEKNIFQIVQDLTVYGDSQKKEIGHRMSDLLNEKLALLP